MILSATPLPADSTSKSVEAVLQTGQALQLRPTVRLSHLDQRVLAQISRLEIDSESGAHTNHQRLELTILSEGCRKASDLRLIIEVNSSQSESPSEDNH